MRATSRLAALLVVIFVLGLVETRLLAWRAYTALSLPAAAREAAAFEELFDQAKIHKNLGFVMRSGALMLQGGYPELALPLFLRATTLEPIPPDAFVGAALAYEALGELQKAQDTLKRGLNYNPIWPALLERCIELSQKLSDLSIDVEASQQQGKICYDRRELLRQIPTWK